MGKGTRTKQSTAELKRIQEENERLLKAKKKKQHRIIALIGIITAAVILISSGSVIAYNSYNNSGAPLRNTVSMSSRSYEVDNAMMTYFFVDTYNSYLATYSSYLSYMGLDSETSLKEQTYSDGVTWFDYMMDQTLSQVNELILFAEAAIDSGLSLSDEEIEAISASVESIDTTEYGVGIKTSDIQKCMEISALGYKYYSQAYSEFSCTEDEINTYYSEHFEDFTTFDGKSYTIDYTADEEAEDGDITQSAALYYANKLKSATSADEFDEVVTEFLISVGGADESFIAEEIDGTVSTGNTYTSGDAVSEWAFDSSRKIGDTYLEDEGDGSYSVYMMTSLPEADTSATKDVRHILFSTDKYGTAAEARTAAEGVLAEWQSGDATEESFGELAALYTDDTGSATTGGLYEGVYAGQMVDEFNDWCFDAARQTGDTAVVDTSYGSHIMYFVGEGLPMWMADVKESLWGNEYESIYTELSEKYEITTNSENLNKIDG